MSRSNHLSAYIFLSSLHVTYSSQRLLKEYLQLILFALLCKDSTSSLCTTAFFTLLVHFSSICNHWCLNVFTVDSIVLITIAVVPNNFVQTFFDRLPLYQAYQILQLLILLVLVQGPAKKTSFLYQLILYIPNHWLMQHSYKTTIPWVFCLFKL